MPVAGETVLASDIPIRGGVQLRRAANQSIPNNTSTSISWDTQDEDVGGFWSAGTTVTVPAGYDGIYVVMFFGLGATGPGARNFAEINMTSSVTGVTNQYRIASNVPGIGEGRMPVYYLGPLAAADSFTCAVLQSTGGATNFTALLTCYKLGN